MSVNRVPTDVEKEAIVKWAESKERCSQKAVQLGFISSTIRSDDIMFFAAELHNENITYSEFSRRRHEVNSYYNRINRAEAERRREIEMRIIARAIQ